MKAKDNGWYLEKLLYLAVEKEKETVASAGRVDLIMDKVYELSLQTRLEAQRLSPKLAFLYGLSIAASVLLGCFIGNLADISANMLHVYPDSLDLLDIGFSTIFPF